MKIISSTLLLALAVSVNVVSASSPNPLGNPRQLSEGGGGSIESYKYECTNGIAQIDYFTTDCTGEVAPAGNGIPADGAAFDKCFNPSDGFSYKTGSCGDGDGVYDTFASNDCTGTVDYVVVVPVGLCCRGGQCESRAIWGTSTPKASPVDSFFDDVCGEGYCIAAINGGNFPECVEGMCCPRGSRGASISAGGLIDGKCVENTCEATLKYDYDATGDIVRPELPDCMTRAGCVSEIVEQGGKQCMRTKGGGNIETQTCVTGGWENQCLGDWGADCSFETMDGTGPGACEFDNLSDEGKEKSGVLHGGALIAVIVAPIIVVLLLCIGGIAVGIYCCCKPGGCCNPEKKKPAVEMTTPAA